MNLFSVRLKKLRIEQNCTARELADYLGLTLRAYQYYEYGGRYPNFAGLLLLADYFQVSLDYLVGRSDCPEIVQPHQGEEET